MPILDPPPSSRPAIPTDPLPQAADSLYDELVDQVFGKAMVWLICAVTVAIMAAIEWVRYLLPVKPTLASTILLSITALAFIAFAVLKTRRALRHAHTLKLGIRGEIHISQYLDQHCPPLGYRVFHDIPCTGSAGPFNIDHALIGPGGIFSIETKNWTLPPSSKGRATINVNGTTLQKSDGTFDSNAPAQAQANADYLQKLLTKLTGRAPDRLPTKPVLLLPGWWVNDPAPINRRPIWILANESLHKLLPNEPPRLTPSDIAQLSEILATHIRNSNP